MRAKKLGEEVARLWSQFHKTLEDFKAKTNGVVEKNPLPKKTSGVFCIFVYINRQ